MLTHTVHCALERQWHIIMHKTFYCTFLAVKVSGIKLRQVHEECNRSLPLLCRIHTPVTFDWW